MDPDELLEDYKQNRMDDFRYIVRLLNQDRKWETIVHELPNYRIPIYLPQRVLERMSLHPSPGEILLDELIVRSCTVANLMEILENGNLLDAMSVLMDLDDIEIKKQPGDNDQLIFVEDGGELKLECYAIGRPPLSYEWYHFNEPLKGFNQSELIIKCFGEVNEGDYHCIVRNTLRDNFTNKKMSNVVICQLMESPPEFIQQMESELTVTIGNYVELTVKLLHPSKCNLQWLKGNSVLDGESSNILKIKSVTKSHEGIYKCVAKNSVGEVFSLPCELKVQTQVHGHNRNVAHAKVALLIANEKYQNHKCLRTPCNDVVQLAKILKELNFHVITLINLSLVEMRNAVTWFCSKILPPKSYAFFYYCGHGFEICNNKFMMPVDCPVASSFLMADCFCDQELIQHAMMKTSKLKLLVIILDMCLDNPDRTQNPKIFEEKTPNFTYVREEKCNMIRAFATSSYQSSYEKAEDSNGLYMKCLMKYLSIDVPLLENLHNAHEDFARNKIVKQKPSVSSDDCRGYKLTDRVLGDPALDDKMLQYTSIGEIAPLYFEHISRECQLIVTPHQDHILNAIDLRFPEWIDMCNWIIGLDAPSVFHVIDDFVWLQMEDGTFRLTLYNIQRAMSDICLTIKLHHQDRTRMLDYSLLDLGRPIMSKAELWFPTHSDGQDMNTNR